MFEFTIEKENKARKLSEDESGNIAKEVGCKFEDFDKARSRQVEVCKLLKDEIYLKDRVKKKKKWKSQVFLNKIYAFFQTRQAFIWDNVYANIEQMFDVAGRDEASDQQARSQKASLVSSFDKMKINKQLDFAIETLDTVGEACLFVGWKRKVKQIRRKMSLSEQVKENGLFNLLRGKPEDAYGMFEQVIYEGANVEAINPLNLVFDPSINPDNEDEWDRGIKIIKRFETYDSIATNKLYQLRKDDMAEIKEAIFKGKETDDDKDDAHKLDELINGNQIEVLHLYGNYCMGDGTVLRNWVITVVGRQYLARFEENPFVINPIVNVATQRDPDHKRGIPTLFSIFDLCKDQENKINLENDVQQLNANPMRYAPKGFFNKAIIEAEPGLVLDYKNGQEDPNMIIPIAVPLFNNSQIISYLESTTSLVSGIFPNMQGQEEDKKVTATEINVKVAGQTTRLAKDVDLLKQNLIVVMVEKVADLEANMKSGEEKVFFNDKGQRMQVTVNDNIRQGNYEYRYTDSSGIQKRLKTNRDAMEVFKLVWSDPSIQLNKIEVIKDALETIGMENTDKFFVKPPDIVPPIGSDPGNVPIPLPAEYIPEAI